MKVRAKGDCICETMVGEGEYIYFAPVLDAVLHHQIPNSAFSSDAHSTANPASHFPFCFPFLCVMLSYHYSV